MQRIDTATAAQDLFGPGKNGFTDGDPQTGVPTTRLNSACFNSLQEELARAIEGSGQVLDPTRYDQLLQAILLLAGQVINNTVLDADTLDGFDSSYFASAADLIAHLQAANPHGITLSGLGGAPLNSPQFTGNPTAPTPGTNDNDSSIATTAFVQAAIMAVLQGAGLAGGFTGSFGPNGWLRLPNGVILQWGRVAGGGGEGARSGIAYPIAFPNAVFFVLPVGWVRSLGPNEKFVDCFVQLRGEPGLATFDAFAQQPGDADNYFEGLLYFALGM